MKDKLLLIKETEKRVVYKLNSIENINNRFMAWFIKKLNKRGAIIIFNNRIKDEYPLISKINPKYSLTVCYSINRERLIDSKISLPKNINVFRFPNINRLKKYYYNHLLSFYKTWKNYLHPKYVEEARYAVGPLLKDTKYLCLRRNNKHVVFVSLIKWRDYIDNPVDWIAYIWIEPCLEKEERKIIHQYILKWLRDNAQMHKIQCVVHSFNIRAQKFFKKLGFVPTCLHILKPE